MVERFLTNTPTASLRKAWLHETVRFLLGEVRRLEREVKFLAISKDKP